MEQNQKLRPKNNQQVIKKFLKNKTTSKRQKVLKGDNGQKIIVRTGKVPKGQTKNSLKGAKQKSLDMVKRS